jgi:hypothetical protein
VTLLVFVSALGVACASAQGIQSQYGIGLGRTIPTGAFRSDTSGEGFDAAWTLTAHVTLRTPSRRLGLRIDAGFGRNGANEQLKADLTTAFGQPADETITLLGADASLWYPLWRSSRFGSSIFSGVGVWHEAISVKAGGATSHSSATKLAWQLGGEITYRALFLELRYVSVAAAKGYPRISFFPLSVGMRFGKSPP